MPTRLTMRIGVATMVTAVLALSSCTTPGTAPTSDEGGGKMVWAIGGGRAQPGGSYQTLTEIWNKNNPDKQVVIETLPESADEARAQHALELQAGGSRFDILGLDVIWTGEYADNGWLESLEGSRSAIESVTLPGPVESSSWGGELFAAPMNTSAGLLYYRTDLVDTPPTTWAELCTMVQEKAGNGVEGYIAQGAKYEGFVVNWLELYWGAGGDLYNDDQSKVLFDVDLAVEVTEFMAKAQKDGCFANGFNTAKEEESRVMFQGGKALFMRNWPFAYGLIEKDDESPARGKVALAMQPTLRGQGTISAIGGFNNAVSKFSKNKEAAIEFVTWIATSAEAQNHLAKEALAPTMESIYTDLADDPVMSALGEILKSSKARPPLPDYNALSVEIQNQMFPAANGESDPKAAAEAVKKKLEELAQQ